MSTAFPSRPISALPHLSSWTALWTLLFACSPPDDDPGQDAPIQYREQWSNADDPSILDASFTYAFDALPTQGTAKRLPWPGNYWPTFQDSINHRWAGSNTPSPAAKYEKAFGKSGVEDAVSRHSGVDSLNTRTCKKHSDCKDIPNSRCARRRGEDRGRCAETWFGLYHTWAPAALLEPEPRRPVVYGGVKFEINDIKALATISYSEGLSVRFMSLRCDNKGSEGDLTELDACKDTNAGSFHVVVTNLLGLQGRSFLEDRTYDYEVWNFPVVAYRVLKHGTVSATTANKLLGAAGSDYAFNSKAARLHRVRLEVQWLGVAPPDLDGPLTPNIHWFINTDVYNYILELDDNGEIIGGEWIGASRTNHPDFLWLPIKKYNTTVAGRIKYSDVKKLIDLASE